MKKMLFSFLLAGLLFSVYAQKANDKSMVKYARNTKMTKPPVAFADPKYMDIGRQMLRQFEQGNIEAYANQFADNAVYL
ncbi:MAG: hypothetical protein ICV84_25905 [Flavisolibacter sp.]|nr:hypothetical protein [Flavisolibacter sp.]